MTNNLLIECSVEGGAWPDEAQLHALAALAFSRTRELASIEHVEGAEVSLVFMDNDGIAELNKHYRGKSGPTNVLTFPQADPPEISRIPLLGDILFADQVVAHEAMTREISLEAHLSHLMVHGLLHIFGYDHETDSDAIEMEDLETAILEKLGYNNPYTALEID